MDELLPKNIRGLTFSHQELITLLKEQLEKDFLKMGVEIKGFNLNSLDEWIIDLTKELKQLEHRHSLQQFLYIVDLPESLSNQILGSIDPLPELAEAVLQREWQKVYFRKMFSNPNSNDPDSLTE